MDHIVSVSRTGQVVCLFEQVHHTWARTVHKMTFRTEEDAVKWTTPGNPFCPRPMAILHTACFESYVQV